MIYKAQMKNLIKKVLNDTGTYYGRKDIDMIYETGMVESRYMYTRQKPSGPARSFWQIEPYTAKSIINNWIKGTRFEEDLKRYRNPAIPLEWDLEQSLFLGIFLCRMQYYFDSPNSIPDTKAGRAKMWVKNYNKGGAGTVEKYLQANKHS